ncbi:MAG: hypothetical protein AAAB35_06600 [Phyllobacterium sp.]
MVTLNPIKERAENNTALQTDIFCPQTGHDRICVCSNPPSRSLLRGTIGAPEVVGMPGVRRAIQMMDDHSTANAMSVITNSILPLRKGAPPPTQQREVFFEVSPTSLGPRPWSGAPGPTWQCQHSLRETVDDEIVMIGVPDAPIKSNRWTHLKSVNSLNSALWVAIGPHFASVSWIK